MLCRHTLREKYWDDTRQEPANAWAAANFGGIYLTKYLIEDTGHFGAESTLTVHLAEKIVWMTENYLFCYGLSNLAQRPIFGQICG